ncbi:delta-60 repeat domain-containing protein [Longispora urticae]
MRRWWFTLGLATALVALPSPVSAAGPSGTLDPTFGVAGKVTVAPRLYNAFSDVLVLPDGRILAAGSVAAGTGTQASALVRLRPDGTPDPAFGTSGLVVTDVPGGADSFRSVTALPDGRILAVGDHYAYPYGRVALVRYLADGTPDPTFGTGGLVLGAALDGLSATTAAVLPDGRIVVGGYVAAGTGEQFAVLRFRADGSPDPSFGTGGLVTGVFDAPGAGRRYDRVSKLTVGPDGRILAAGQAGRRTPTSGYYYAFGVLRLRPDGTPDPTFGGDGTVTTQSGRTAIADTVVLQPDGRVVVTGIGTDPATGRTRAALARYRTNGTLDPTFGPGGLVLADLGGMGLSSRVSGVTLRPDGRIVVVGTAERPGFLRDALLARYLPDGTLDTSFSDDGVVVADNSGTGVFDSLSAVALQPDGALVATGLETTSPGAAQLATFFRYLS